MLPGRAACGAYATRLPSSRLLGPCPATTRIAVVIEDPRQSFAVIDLRDLCGKPCASHPQASKQFRLLDDGCQMTGEARWVAEVAIKGGLAHLLATTGKVG